MSPPKALETIGNNLHKQYDRWQPRARYKQSLDPTGEEVKKLCTTMRRNAKVINCLAAFEFPSFLLSHKLQVACFCFYH